MPLYEYRCLACGRTFESYTRSSDAMEEESCPTCGGSAGKLKVSLFSAAGDGEKAGKTGCEGGNRRSPFR
jgi:putative FmdB family regulatory protein